VQPNLLAKAISAISKDITLEEFRAKSGIAGKTMARYVLDYLVKNGIGESFRHCYSFSNEDRMKLAVLALQSGTDIEMISKSLSWQDFEAFASQLLNLSGYVAECNLNFSEPSRMQIDVVGINYDSRLAIVVDCKHWKRNNLSLISSYARKQAQRTSVLLLQIRKKISHAIPVILTLYSMDIRLVGGVPVVPIVKFNSFIKDVPLHISKIKVISANPIPNDVTW
jgi:Restriction endonuclease